MPDDKLLMGHLHIRYSMYTPDYDLLLYILHFAHNYLDKDFRNAHLCRPNYVRIRRWSCTLVDSLVHDRYNLAGKSMLLVHLFRDKHY